MSTINAAPAASASSTGAFLSAVLSAHNQEYREARGEPQ